MKIRAMTDADLPMVFRIQRECYSASILESVDSFAAKLSAAPDFCFVAVEGQRVVGYVVSLPWPFGKVPELDATEYPLPEKADGLCIHDLAVTPDHRAAGAAKRLLAQVLEAASHQGYQRVFLVAIQGASSYWRRHGFEAVLLDESLKAALSAYGQEAVYMARRDTFPNQ